MHRQTILTKILHLTDHSPQRFKAWASGSRYLYAETSVTMSRDYALTYEAMHKHVANALATKLAWHCRWYGGPVDSKMLSYVFVPEPEQASFSSAFKNTEADTDYRAAYNELLRKVEHGCTDQPCSICK